MRRNLILGLGNPLMGDDGVGCRVVELLADRLPPDTEALCGGSDVLRWADQMAGRTRVILIDAILGEGAPGSVVTFEEPFAELQERQWNAHHLSAPQAILLLRTAFPEFRKVRFILLGVTIQSAELRPALSAALNARLPEILEHVLRL